MAEQSSSDTSVTHNDQGVESAPSLEEDFVKIPKSQFQLAVVKMRQQQRQLLAACNLHRLMREKEEELLASKEQVRQMQLVLQQSETRVSSLIRLQAAVAATSSPATTHSLEEDGAFSVHAGETLITYPELGAFAKSSGESCLTYSDVEPDGEISVKRQQSSVLAGKDAEKPVMIMSEKSTPSVTVSQLPLSSVTSAPALESKDLLDKVLQQNARLKKTLRDLLSLKGLSVSTYLVCYPAVTSYV